MGSDESHFNVSVGSDGQSHKTVSTNHNLFWRERRAEAVSNRGPSAYQPNALPLGQTGSPFLQLHVTIIIRLTATSLGPGAGSVAYIHIVPRQQICLLVGSGRYLPHRFLTATGPVCMEKGFATLPVNSTQAVATVAVRIWFGSHAWVTEGPAGK